MLAKKKLAIISSRFPYPLNKGDKLRLFHQLKHLSQHFEIHLHAINEEKITEEEQKVVRNLCATVRLYNLNPLEQIYGIGRSIIKNEPIQVGYFYSSRIKNSIAKRLISAKIDAVYCQLSRTAYYGLVFNGPVIFDYQDCFSKNYERAIEHHTGLKKIFFQRECKHMKTFEEFIHHSFVAKIIISAFDKEQLPFNAEKIHVIPNGVDKEYYKEQSVEKKYDILFSGNLNYQPNEQAALYIINELAPILKKSYPQIRIGIAGNTNNKDIIAAQNNTIFIETEVQDMRDMYAQTRVFIAPLFSGAGLQNKLLEAMSMRIPCIATSVTNLSLKAEPKKEIVIADNANEFVVQILYYLKNQGERDLIAQNGQGFIHKNYNWERPNEDLAKLIKSYLPKA